MWVDFSVQLLLHSNTMTLKLIQLLFLVVHIKMIDVQVVKFPGKLTKDSIQLVSRAATCLGKSEG